MVLSARHGLIPADKVLNDYDCLLGRDRSEDALVAQLEKQLKGYRLKNVHVVASKKYAEALRLAGLKDVKFVSGGIGVKRRKLRGLL